MSFSRHHCTMAFRVRFASLLAARRVAPALLMMATGLGGCVQSTSGRGAAAASRGDWGTAMMTYELDPSDDTRARDEAATKWIRGELVNAQGFVDAGDGEKAFGIASTLSREAKKRNLL